MDDTLNQEQQTGGADRGGGKKPFDPEQAKTYLKQLWSKAFEFLSVPERAWNNAASEPEDPITLYKSYLLPMAAIPAIGMFFGDLFATRFRAGFTPLTDALFLYVFWLAGIAVFALFLEQLAGKQNFSVTRSNAFMLAGYTMTPAFLAYALYAIVPAGFLKVLAAILSLYSVYLLWIGVPRMVAVSEVDRNKVFTLSVALGFGVAIVFAILLSAV